MEAILRLNDETPNSLLHSGEIIYAPRASALRCPQSEQTCISFLLGMGESAEHLGQPQAEELRRREDAHQQRLGLRVTRRLHGTRG